jgi:hypothetical protein
VLFFKLPTWAFFDIFFVKNEAGPFWITKKGQKVREKLVYFFKTIYAFILDIIFLKNVTENKMDNFG